MPFTDEDNESEHLSNLSEITQLAEMKPEFQLKPVFPLQAVFFLYSVPAASQTRYNEMNQKIATNRMILISLSYYSFGYLSLT